MSGVDRDRLPVANDRQPWVSIAAHLPTAWPRTGPAPPGAAGGAPVLLVPGAGGTLDDEGLVVLAELVSAAGHLAVRANLPYREAGRRGPPRAEREVASYAAVLAAVAERYAPDTPWVVGGRSFGARVATLLAAGPAPVAGVLCLAYPLHPPHRPDVLRVAHWPQVAVPVLLIQGTRDAFCDPAVLARFTPTFAGPVTVHRVADADHQLRVAAALTADRRVRPAARTLAGLGPTVQDWLGALGGGGAGGV